MDTTRSHPGQPHPSYRLPTCPHPFNFVQEAIYFRGFGFSVFPCIGKRPAVRWRQFQECRATDWELARISHALRRRRCTPTGIAVVCGWVSGGLCVRDFDRRDAYRHWAQKNPRIAGLCPTVITPRGAHVYCRLRRQCFARWPDGELRGTTGQYVLLPPSDSGHPSGVRHCWGSGEPRRSDFPLLDLPETGFVHADHRLSSGPRTSNRNGWKRPTDPYAARHNNNRTTPCVTQVIYLGSASLEAQDALVRDVVFGSLPSGPGERHERLFHLARCLKGKPEFAKCDAIELEGVVRHWFNLALSAIRTKQWSETWRDFRNAWDDVKYPAGEGPVIDLMTEAAAGELPDEVGRFRDLPTRKLLAVCRALDQDSEGRSFFVSCRLAADVCGFKSHMTASRRLHLSKRTLASSN
jgi:hypothetical protein